VITEAKVSAFVAETLRAAKGEESKQKVIGKLKKSDLFEAMMGSVETQ
jgi:hypothetical protein